MTYHDVQCGVSGACQMELFELDALGETRIS